MAVHVYKDLDTNTNASDNGLEKILSGKAAVCFKNFLSKDDVAAATQAIYLAKDEWSEGFGGLQYSFGEAWYHYAEEGIDFDEYAEKAYASRKLIDKYIPGLERKVIDFLNSLAGPMTVDVREGWAGPGFIIFPAHNHVAQNGGSIHFDTDAFTDEELQDKNLTMLSFVCMLQKPDTGGNLRIWEKKYDPALDREQDFTPSAEPAVESSHVEYQPGDLWMFNGMCAHSIEPFTGDTDRICLTFHLYRYDNEWLMWF